ncbi:MAG: class I SAM-dependent methyltransferase [Deltaproteobacteria bacterium]|nr:class I SAM-dependent methyltransferase [Deltaproteobacteria bacterium]
MSSDTRLQTKWNRLSRMYDMTGWADDRRFATAKRRLFAGMRGDCLMVAAGTGNDFKFFPPGHTITAIDISPGMVERARRKAATYDGSLEVRLMNVHTLEFADARFDTVVTACTFCSVPEPLRGLRELYRCLKPGGRLLMFEHVRSRVGPIAILQDLMTAITRRFGPEMNRETVSNALRAGFELVREENVYLDVVKAIEARRPQKIFAAGKSL